MTAAERWRLARAAAEAKAHAMQLAEATTAEAVRVADVRESDNVRYYADRYWAFALASWMGDDAVRPA